jgi:hypothetical protein
VYLGEYFKNILQNLDNILYMIRPLPVCVCVCVHDACVSKHVRDRDMHVDCGKVYFTSTWHEKV